jgi:hypothetical protein
VPEVTYTLTWQDLFTGYTFALKRSPLLRKRLAVSRVVILLGLPAVALGLWLAGVYPPVAIGLAVTGAILGLFFPIVRLLWILQSAWQVADAAAKQGLAPQTLTMTDDELRVQGQVTNTTARWAKMHGVVAGADHTYILLAEQEMVVVSRTAVGDDAVYAVVRDFAAARLPDRS